MTLGYSSLGVKASDTFGLFDIVLGVRADKTGFRLGSLC